MKYEIKLAEAVKIEKSKQYLVIFESDRPGDATDFDYIKEQTERLFKEFGAKAKPVVILDGRLKIAELPKRRRAPAADGTTSTAMKRLEVSAHNDCVDQVMDALDGKQVDKR